MTPVLANRLGTDRSFERLYKKYAGDVYRYALVVLRNQADAEDVTQTTFMNAFRAMERGERPRSPQNWLIAIAHNVCRQRFRQSQRRPNEVAYEEELAEAVVDDDAISAEDIRRALGHIAFNQRSALVMRELEGRSYQEIAEILGTTVSAVETLIFRARRALREQLEEGITCHEAELAISRQLDGRLSRKGKGALRAHLRECSDCSGFARSQRAQRGAIKSLSLIPLPQSLTGLFGGGSGAAVGSGLAVKAAAVAAGAALATGAGYEGVHHGIIPTGRAGQATAAKKHETARTRATTAARDAAYVVAPAQEARHDQKPFTSASVKARSVHRKSVGRSTHVKPERLAKPAHRKGPPATARGHRDGVKPAEPARPTKPTRPVRTSKPHTNRGRHTGQTKPKKPAPPTAKHGGGKAKAPPQQPDEAAAASGHGKSAR